MFYELNSWDPAGNTPWKRDIDSPLNGTFEGDTNVFAQIVEVVDPDVEFAQQDEIGDPATPNILGTFKVNATSLNAADVDIEIGVPPLLPDG